MVKRKKIKLDDAIAAIDEENSKGTETPFGDTSYKEVSRLKKSSPLARILEASVSSGVKKKKKKPKDEEVLLFPEKQSFETPRKSKLSKAPREVEHFKKKIDNIVRVPKEQLDTFMDTFTSASKNISNDFLASVAPVFLAYEDAMNYSTVALRDGLSYDGEIDLDLAPLLEWSARLNTFELYLNQLISMSPITRERILKLATLRAIDKAFSTKGNSQGLSPSSTSNKVAGIVTRLKPKADVTKIKTALNAVKTLKDVSKLAKESNSPIPGVMKNKHRFRT